MRGRKIVYGFCLLSVFILNCLYVDFYFFMLLMLLILVPLVSCIMYLGTKIKLKLFVMVRDKFLTKGDELFINVKVTNSLGVKPPYSKVDMQVTYSNSEENYNAKVAVDMFGVKGDEEYLSFKTLHCGIVNVNVNGLKISDLLQMCDSQYEYSLTRRVVVYPQKIDIGEDVFYLESENECAYTRLGTDNTEIVDLRAYSEGDSLNKIHWKLSAISEDLIVKHYGDEEERHINIMVDLTKYMEVDFRDNLDLIYQAAYSFAAYLCDRQIVARFMVWNEDEKDVLFIDFADEDELKEAMQQLMSVRCTSGNLNQLDREISLRGDELMYDESILITQIDIKNENITIINVKGNDLCETLRDIA